MKNIYRTLILGAVILPLSACGNTTSERMISGGGIGAGAGAVTGAVTGGSPVGGALIGGALGAAAGGLTNSSQLNLGQPLWK